MGFESRSRQRVWLDVAMTSPGLAMARSIGDHLVDRVGVIAEPEVTIRTVTLPAAGEESTAEMPLAIVLASDGVWEFMGSQQVVDIIARPPLRLVPPHAGKREPSLDAPWRFNATTATTRLIEVAKGHWKEKEGDYRDDITAIAVRLADVFGPREEETPIPGMTAPAPALATACSALATAIAPPSPTPPALSMAPPATAPPPAPSIAPPASASLAAAEAVMMEPEAADMAANAAVPVVEPLALAEAAEAATADAAQLTLDRLGGMGHGATHRTDKKEAGGDSLGALGYVPST